ncbi:MAG: ATP-dependent DNA helicase [Candidatus Saccharimonadales bacterium]
MTLFEREYKRLNAAQKQAVDTIDGPVLVVAGPGTGKTQLLTTRVANILLKTDAQPQNILCLTFTESAAYEMRERLISIVGQAAYNITISTYHAFGRELIARFQDYFDASSDLQAVDELGIHTIVRDIIAGLDYNNALKRSQYYLGDVISIISDFKRALLTPADVRSLAAKNLAFRQQVNRHCRRELKGIARISKQSLPVFTALLKATKSEAIEQYALPKIQSLAYLWNLQLETAITDAQASGKTSPITAWKNAWLARDSDGEFTLSGEQANRKLLALADIYEAYLDQLSHRGLYDYDDMILKAIDGLKNNRELRYTLQEQYMYILLDEFQDTNAAQLELVRLLTDNPAYEGKPNILAVGDDDQAIYAFQGADYSNMLSFKDLYPDVLVISLTENYRSHGDVLHVAHGVSQQIESRLHHQLTEVNKLITAENKQLPAKAQVARHEFKSDVAQYAWVTATIAKLIKAGTPASQIAVLAPQHRYLEPLIPYLRQLKIPVRYDKRENVLEDIHVVQILRMAQLVLCLRDHNYEQADSLWPEILSYDFWQLPTELIWQLSWQAYDQRLSWTKLIMDGAETKLIGRFFANLASLSSIETLETMLDYLVGVSPVAGKSNQPAYSSPFYEFFFGKAARQNDVASFWSLLSNLTVLRQHLREHNNLQDSQLMLADLVEFANDHVSADIKVLNTSPYHEAMDAVQVMTAFKAKGMEFERVFVLACVDEVWGSRAKSNSAKIPLPPNLAFVRYQGASQDERLRLLFVAITRAKLGLYLTSYQSNFAGRPTTRLQYLQEDDEADKTISRLLPATSQQVIKEQTDSPQVSELSAYWQSRHVNPKTTVSLQSLLKQRLDRYQLSPTHLNSFTDLFYAGPEAFFLNTILRFPSAPTVDGEYGDAIHETIRWIHSRQLDTKKLPSLSEVLKSFSQRLKSRRLSQRDFELLLKRGHTSLTSFYAQKKAAFDINDRHEVSFKSQGVLVGEAHLNGQIDKLIIDKKNRTITIVDYKTGDSYKSWSKNNPKLHKYAQQLYFYKMLVEGSYEYSDYSVSAAYLEFVEPDDDGKIVDLHINFSLAEAQRLKRLIGQVWQHIKRLDFPDISDYPQSSKGIESFEDDLINGKI